MSISIADKYHWPLPKTSDHAEQHFSQQDRISDIMDDLGIKDLVFNSTAEKYKYGCTEPCSGGFVPVPMGSQNPSSFYRRMGQNFGKTIWQSKRMCYKLSIINQRVRLQSISYIV